MISVIHRRVLLVIVGFSQETISLMYPKLYNLDTTLRRECDCFQSFRRNGAWWEGGRRQHSSAWRVLLKREGIPLGEVGELILLRQRSRTSVSLVGKPHCLSSCRGKKELVVCSQLL
ncbi:hypothetical protein BDV28DRAFT_137721 [Aspergillus coremiiformis]|uniref:Uncharacterized protein n=1 Tax=Aspergillus coremiiformis TaxID=138285 RepID=A0A5N6Z1Z2_9EURO|nr:hypothetical protein BDV28DRAFT_137721 [Aspergillus coremiiformis]